MVEAVRVGPIFASKVNVLRDGTLVIQIRGAEAARLPSDGRFATGYMRYDKRV